METYAIVVPNKHGQPQYIRFPRSVLQAWGDVGAVGLMLLPGDVLTLTPSAAGVRIRVGKKSTQKTPMVPAPDLLSRVNEAEQLDTAPRHAELQVDGTLAVYLRQPLTAVEYKWRRFGRGARKDAPIDAEGTYHASREQAVQVRFQPDVFDQLSAEASALSMTLGTYLAHIVTSCDRTAIPAPVATNAYAARALQASMTRSGQQLSGEELLARNLIPASDEAWLRARLAEGMSYAEMSRRFKCGTPEAYARWGKKFGIITTKEERIRRSRRSS